MDLGVHGHPTGPHGRRRASRLVAAMHGLDSTRDSASAHSADAMSRRLNPLFRLDQSRSSCHLRA